MKTFLDTLTEASNALNQLNPTETDVTRFVTEIQDMNMKKVKWEKEMDYLIKGQNVLKLQRYV
jgi:hypothetical protein